LRDFVLFSQLYLVDGGDSISMVEDIVLMPSGGIHYFLSRDFSELPYITRPAKDNMYIRNHILSTFQQMLIKERKDL